VSVEHWNESIDGQLSEEAMRRKLEGLGYSVTRYTYPSGTYFGEHNHGVDKIDAVLSGRFCITLGGQSAILEAGDFIHVPRGTVHTAEVGGSESVVSLDAIKG
jgi:quercetin dioxygenase-like cupin family protein